MDFCVFNLLFTKINPFHVVEYSSILMECKENNNLTIFYSCTFLCGFIMEKIFFTKDLFLRKITIKNNALLSRKIIQKTKHLTKQVRKNGNENTNAFLNSFMKQGVKKGKK